MNLQVAPALQLSVQRCYYDTMQRMTAALQNVCADFNGDGYSRVSVWQHQQPSMSCIGCSHQAAVYLHNVSAQQWLSRLFVSNQLTTACQCMHSSCTSP